MKRLAMIAGAAGVVLASLGAGAYIYLSSDAAHVMATATHQSHNVVTADAQGSTAGSAGFHRLLQQLSAAQDRVIQGDFRALADQGRLLAEISEVLRRFEKQDWENHVNIRGAFVYVLSGGDHSVLRALVDDETLYAADRNLAEGIMEFAQGNGGTAKKLLNDVDPRSLDVSLVGPFALAQSSFYIGHDDAKAIALLDEARLARPHSAIEEAAARREIPILIATGDVARATRLVGDYLRRFGKSIYAPKLYGDFADAAARREELDSPDLVNAIIKATAAADKKARIDLLLALAGAALPSGKISLAKAAAYQVISLDPAAIADVDKAKLYAAAAEAPTINSAAALNALRGVATDRLSGDDPDMHDAAAYIARTVSRTRFPENGIGKTAHAARPNADGEFSAKSKELSLLADAVESADAVLKQADGIISGNAK